MDTQHPTMPAASVAELRALAAALPTGESVRWAVRQSSLPFRWTALRLLLAGFALMFLCAGIGVAWEAWSSGPCPLSWQEWQRLDAFDLAGILLRLLVSHAIALGACLVGGVVLYYVLVPEKGGLCVFTEAHILVLPVRGELVMYPLRPGMEYHLAFCPDGRGGSLILSAREEWLSSPLGDCVENLPDLRAAEDALLALTCQGEWPERESPRLSRWLDDATQEQEEQVALALCRGERLLWAERPIPAFFPYGEVQKFAFFVLFVTVSAGLFLLAWLGAGETGGSLLAIGAITGFMALAGLAGLLRPLRWRRKMVRTLYLVTTRRALILEPDWRGDWHCFAYPLEPGLIKLSRTHAGGGGDLVFALAENQPDADRNLRGFVNLHELAQTQQELLAAIAARSSC